MEKKVSKTAVLNPPTSVVALINELDSTAAQYLEFLLMEIHAGQALQAEEHARLKKNLPYDEVLMLISQVRIRSQILARYNQELDRLLDRILDLAPDVEE
jgi:hypothetical protein